MAIRFIDTSFYKSPFVRGLQGAYKGLYSFIICDCNGAGIWAKDLPIASEYVGIKLTEEGFQKNFIRTGKAIDLNNGKFFFPDFIEHQYPKGLQAKNPAHTNVILELQKFDLIDENLRISVKGVASPLQGAKDTVIVKDKVKEEVKAKESEEIVFPFNSPNFMFWWEAWIKYRKDIRKPYKSDLSIQAALKGLSKYTEQQACEMIEQSIANQWQGIFEIKTNNNGKTKQNAGDLAREAIEISRRNREKRNQANSN